MTSSGGGGVTIEPSQCLFQSATGGCTWSGEFATLHAETAAAFTVLVPEHRYLLAPCETVALVSPDGSRTWSRNKYYISAGSGYPASVAVKDGTIVTLVGNTRLDAGGQPIEFWNVQATRWEH